MHRRLRVPFNMTTDEAKRIGQNDRLRVFRTFEIGDFAAQFIPASGILTNPTHPCTSSARTGEAHILEKSAF